MKIEKGKTQSHSDLEAGARPSSGAATSKAQNLLKPPEPNRRQVIAAAEDGRAPGTNSCHRHFADARGEVVNLGHRLEADVENMHTAQAENVFHRFIALGVVVAQPAFAHDRSEERRV